MPFRSTSQRAWMFANHPAMAERWQKHTPKGTKLPEHVKEAMLGGFLDELEKIAGISQWSSSIDSALKNFGHTLRGSKAEALVQKYHSGVMGSPYMQKVVAHHGPENISTLEGYMKDVLRGAKSAPQQADLPRKTDMRIGLVHHLQEGANAVKQEQQKTRNARLFTGGAVVAPLAAAGLAKEADDSQSVVPVIAAGTAGAVPIAQGIASHALNVRPTKGKKFLNIAEMRANLKPGDIMLTSSPGKGGRFKPLISALGGDPYGYHVETVTDAPPGGARDPIEYVHSSPGAGGAKSEIRDFNSQQDVIVRRFKNPEHVQPYLENLKKREGAESVLGDMFGSKARQSMYDKGQAVRAAGKSFLPAPLARLFEGGPSSPGMAVCSSLPGQASPICLEPGVAGRDILPHHVRRSEALMDVGHFHAPRTLPQKMYEGVLHASPWLIRGALGAGLGYGAYRAVKAFRDRSPT